MPLKTEQLSHKTTSLEGSEFPIVLICDAIQSPANVGSLFRLADAMGISHIYFCTTKVDLSSNRLKRTSRSCERLVNFSETEDPVQLIKSLKNQSYQILGLELTNTSIPLEDFKVPQQQKLALVLGNERRGISEIILDQLNATIHIPMHGSNSSMNVTHAAAIAVYHLINKAYNG